MERVILHCDCNSFFASVELLSHPELAHVPVAVCGNPKERHGIILAKNEPAKKFGIQTAETIYSALRKCPQLTLLAPHYHRYAQYSQAINTIYNRFTDLIESFGIDESWLDITGSWQLFGASPLEVAHEIRRTVKNETGLTISIGVSFNKIFAKLGSDYKKPDAVTVFGKDTFKYLVWPMPVGNLLYVGKSAQESLASLGIKNIGQLAAAAPLALQQRLGKLGPELWRYARGEDDAPVRAYTDHDVAKSVGNGQTFRRNLVGLADAKTGIFALADSVASRLRRHGLFCTAVQIMIKDTTLKSISRQAQTPYPTQLAKDIGSTCLALLQEHWDLRQPIRMLTVTALQLTDGSDAQQLSLLDEEKKPNEKRTRLEQSMDSIREKYGKRAIAAASAVGNDIGIGGLTMQRDTEPEE